MIYNIRCFKKFRVRSVEQGTLAILVCLFGAVAGCRQNNPPVVLEGPIGPEVVALRRTVGFSVVVDDVDMDMVRVRCDWGDGDTSDWSSEEPPVCTLVLAHAWQRTGSYQVRCQAADARSGRSAWSAPKTIVVSSGLPGSIIWTYQTEGDVRGVPALGPDRTVYVAAEGGQVYALSHSGELGWRTGLGSRILSTPVLGDNGTVYIGTANSLCALSPDGRVKWRFPAAGPVDAGPALSRDGRIYVACRTSFFYALDTAGILLWQYNVGGTLSSAAVGQDGTVYVGGGDEDRSCYAFWPDGTVRWRYVVGCGVHSSPAIGTDGTVYFGAQDGGVYAVDSSGGLRWKYQTGGRVLSGPVLDEAGVVYAGSYDGYLYALNPDGTLRWRFKTDGNILASPAVSSDGTVCVGSFDGWLYGVGRDGTRSWRAETRAEIRGSLTIGPDSIVYFGTSDGRVWAVKAGGVIANSCWPKSRCDLQNTGRVSIRGAGAALPCSSR